MSKDGCRTVAYVMEVTKIGCECVEAGRGGELWIPDMEITDTVGLGLGDVKNFILFLSSAISFVYVLEF